MRCVHIIIIFMERNWKISHIIFKTQEMKIWKRTRASPFTFYFSFINSINLPQLLFLSTNNVHGCIKLMACHTYRVRAIFFYLTLYFFSSSSHRFNERCILCDCIVFITKRMWCCCSTSSNSNRQESKQRIVCDILSNSYQVFFASLHFSSHVVIWAPSTIHVSPSLFFFQENNEISI